MNAPTPSSTDPAAAAKSFMRRRQMLAAILLALAALAFWSASRLVWCRVLAADGLAPARDFDVKGSDWSPWLTPLALVLLAAILAAFSVRGWGLRVIAILVAAGGVLAAIPAISLMTGGADSGYAADAANLPGRFQVLLITTNSWAAVVALAGTVCAVLAGVLLLRVAGGAGMSSKYKSPGARRAELERQIFAEHERTTGATTGTATTGDTASDDASRADGRNEGPAANERMMWDALDTGIDPTDVPETPADDGRERPTRPQDDSGTGLP
ncbi:TIGR02234 family membrane protein [Gordonia hankookensis]|uniref:TIGR02234 family membrane protein n=1 Tax=Gordonia hankookensis TaxID=589403 RepID=A0ABR7W5C8_9ACTN|nr:TIGR02234 family membrane protein [Gordonia hankookensis]MBD1318036.1 TIGR02234 family membrane protein [Gordonia hankookensis]